MSIECGECEHDLRGPHARDCSLWRLWVCPHCDRRVQEGDGYEFCPQHGEVQPVALVRALPAAPAEDVRAGAREHRLVTAAKEARDIAIRHAALKEAADLFQLHPWSWNAKETREKILALIPEAKP